MARRYDFYGRITQESIERMRLRIGVRMPAVPAWYREAHHDTMRHFAWSFGDDNPLFGEPGYGASTRWGAIIAAPFYYANLAEPIADEITPEMRQRTAGALAGLHEFHASSEVWFYRPIYPGDTAVSARWVSDVQERASSFGGGKSVLRELEEVVETGRGDPVLRHRSTFIHTERDTAKKAGTERKTIKMPHYSPDEISAVEADIMRETRRGSTPRYWEDVHVGDSLPTLTKGPMTLTDVLAGHIGRGPGHYAWGPLRLAAYKRNAHPGFYTRNEFGGWDVVQRVHWDKEWAQEVGTVRPYDYGTMRQNWLGHLLTDWMGDDAVIRRFRCEFRKFNYVGDISRVQGVVTAKNDDGTVEVTMSCVNQDGADTCPGDATIALPTRDHPHPSFSDVPADWAGPRR